MVEQDPYQTCTGLISWRFSPFEPGVSGVSDKSDTRFDKNDKSVVLAAPLYSQEHRRGLTGLQSTESERFSACCLTLVDAPVLSGMGKGAEGQEERRGFDPGVSFALATGAGVCHGFDLCVRLGLSKTRR